MSAKIVVITTLLLCCLCCVTVVHGEFKPIKWKADGTDGVIDSNMDEQSGARLVASWLGHRLETEFPHKLESDSDPTNKELSNTVHENNVQGAASKTVMFESFKHQYSVNGRNGKDDQAGFYQWTKGDKRLLNGFRAPSKTAFVNGGINGRLVRTLGDFFDRLRFESRGRGYFQLGGAQLQLY